MSVACAGAEGEGFSLSRQAMYGEEVQIHQYHLVHDLHVPCGWTRPGMRQNTRTFTATAHKAGSEEPMLPIFTSDRPILWGSGMVE